MGRNRGGRNTVEVRAGLIFNSHTTRGTGWFGARGGGAKKRAVGGVCLSASKSTEYILTNYILVGGRRRG